VQHVPDEGFATGKALVQHAATTAVGFTGSYQGGMALQSYAAERKHPIPVFAEMGSTNPVLLLPGALADDAAGIAAKYAASITLGMGQFCTNPGLILAMDCPALLTFFTELQKVIEATATGPMLHKGIEQAYFNKTAAALAQKEVELLAASGEGTDNALPQAYIARIQSADFLANPLVHEEIFGPWSLVVVCNGLEEMVACRQAVAGQLTTTLMCNEEDLAAFPELVDTALYHAGRVVFNGVPTGVEVCAAMVHGGPHPATTDPRFTAVGPQAIQRWTRPVCWQNAPQHVLPDELKDENPKGVRRMVDGVFI
jgi:NADP-dependent aldehyde dehydrogenase